MAAMTQREMEPSEELALLMHDVLCRKPMGECRFSREIHPRGAEKIHNWNGVSHVKFHRAATALIDSMGHSAAVAQVNELASAISMD